MAHGTSDGASGPQGPNIRTTLIAVAAFEAVLIAGVLAYFLVERSTSTPAGTSATHDAAAAHRAAAPGAPLAASDAVGTWTLVDSENATFDVVLAERGAAVSNWSKGPTGAAGEEGHWAIREGQIEIDYEDGWRDVVLRGEGGRLEKRSYGPGADRNAPPTNFGQAVRAPADAVAWIGVHEVPSAESRGAKTFRIALKSSGLALKTIGTPKSGVWWVDGDRACIRWADGWTDELRLEGEAVLSATWHPGTKADATGWPVGDPDFRGRGHRVIDRVKAPAASDATPAASAAAPASAPPAK